MVFKQCKQNSLKSRRNTKELFQCDRFNQPQHVPFALERNWKSSQAKIPHGEVERNRWEPNR